MMSQFEKILLIILISVFGIFPPFAYLMLSNISAEVSTGAQDILHSDNGVIFISSSAFEQLAAILTAFVVKPIYTILALFIAVFLWKKTEIELKALKWSMIFFFLGENFCAANFLFTENHDSHMLEYLHSLGMVLSFGFATYALIEGIDQNALHYSEPKKTCSLTSFCRQCHKYENASCGLQSFFIFLGIAGAIVALMPLSAELHLVSYNTTIWGTLYNYNHPIVYQLVEVRYYPFLAAALFLAASLTLWCKRENPLQPSKLLFAAALGVMGFSFFRFIVFHGFRTKLVWMDFWEEVTEFVYVMAVILMLWIFRSQLFLKNNKPRVTTDLPANNFRSSSV